MGGGGCSAGQPTRAGSVTWSQWTSRLRQLSERFLVGCWPATPTESRPLPRIREQTPAFPAESLRPSDKVSEHRMSTSECSRTPATNARPTRIALSLPPLSLSISLSPLSLPISLHFPLLQAMAIAPRTAQTENIDRQSLPLRG